MSNDLEFSLGLDNGPFKVAGQQTVAAASGIAGEISKKFEFKDVGRTLATALGINLDSIAQNVARLIAGVSKQQEDFFKRMIELSDQTTEIYTKGFAERLTAQEKLQKSIEASAKIDAELAGIRAAQAERFAIAQKEAEAGFGPAAQFARFAQQTDAESLRIAELTKKQAELKFEIEKGTTSEKQKQLDRQKELHDFIFADAEAQRKINDQYEKIADADYDKRRLQGDQARDALILQSKLIAGTITPAEKNRLDILKLTTKQLEINADIDQALLVPANQRNEFQRQHLAHLLSQNDAVTKQIDLLKAAGTAAGGVANVAAKIDDSFHFALNTLKSFVEEWTGFTTSVTSSGRGNADLSDRELQRKIDETNKDIAARQAALLSGFGGVGGGGQGPYDPFLGAQQSNLTQAQAEQNFREQVRQAVASLGADRAFSEFPGLTEARLQQILGTYSDTSKSTDLLEDISKQLKQGLLVVNKT